MPPDISESNAQAWALYELFDTQWQLAPSGYRHAYQYSSLLQFAGQLGATPSELTDLIERVKVIENAVLSVEYERYLHDEAERQRKAKQPAHANSPALIGQG